MKKQLVRLLPAAFLFAAAAVLVGVLPGGGDAQAAGGTRIANVGPTDCGNMASMALPADIPGAKVMSVSEAAFNEMSPLLLRSKYDVILINDCTDESLRASWNGKLRFYAQYGGGIIIDGYPNNVLDLSGLARLAPDHDGSGDIHVMWSPLRTGVSDNLFDNNHAQFESWNAGLRPFLTNEGGVVGVYGMVNGGCVILTGPDQDYHSERGGDAQEANQYRLLLNEVKWAAGGCRSGGGGG